MCLNLSRQPQQGGPVTPTQDVKGAVCASEGKENDARTKGT